MVYLPLLTITERMALPSTKRRGSGEAEPLSKDFLTKGIKPPVEGEMKEILSRVGDRPTATILQVQFHFFDFCFVFEGKIFDQNMPLLEGPIIP